MPGLEQLEIGIVHAAQVPGEIALARLRCCPEAGTPAVGRSITDHLKPLAAPCRPAD